MGTVFTIDVRDPGRWDGAVAAVVAWLHRVEDVFSTYRENSDVSRIRRGELRVEDADPDVAAVLGLSSRLEAETGGHFTARWGGSLDPTGAVKGWAIELAGELLRAHGSHHHAINGGGDIQLAGQQAPGAPWRVGIADPFDRNRLLTVVEGRDFSVATSGVAERGAHIVDPVSGRPAVDLASVTVIGGTLARADAYATAAFAMGRDALAWLEALPGHEAMVVGADGAVGTTSGFFRA